MFMRHSRRRFFLFGSIVVFFWIFIFSDDVYEAEPQAQQRRLSSNIHRFDISIKDIKHHEVAEDIIFGQGILGPHSAQQSQKYHDSVSHYENVGINTSRDANGGDENPINDKNSISDLSGSKVDHISLKRQDQEPLLTIDVNKHQDKQTLNTKNYPARYQNVIDESANNEHEIPNPLIKETETKLNNIKDYHKFHPGWMRITDDIYTYSAFWDHRQELVKGPVARVLGILRYKEELLQDEAAFKWNGNIKDNMLNCSCLLWYKEREEPHLGLLRAFIFEEGRQVFAGTFFLCYPQQENNTRDYDNLSSHANSKNAGFIRKNLVPYAVSLYPDGTINAPHKLIYLNHNLKTDLNSYSDNNTTAVCVRALYGPYNDLREIIQFVSYYSSVLKISHFYFYDLAIGFNVSKLIESLSTVGLIFDVLPWNLPTSEWGELWDVGSLTALNDCVYRSSGRHSHVAIVDLDEYIVPRTPVTGLSDLYQNVLKYKRGQHGDAALISNYFFCYDFKRTDSNAQNNNTFPIFKFTQRETRLWPPTSRSKMVVVPETIVSVGHHMVHNFLLKALANRSSPKLVSVLHHYRVCADLRLGIHANGEKVLEEPTVKDHIMMKFKSRIMNSKPMALYRKFLHSNR